MRKGNKLIQDGKVPKKRTLNTQVLTDIVNGYYLDGIEAGYKAGYDYGYEDGARCQDEVQYQHGFEDAWGMLKSICIGGRERMLKVFGTISITKIITDNTASEAKAKIDAWEQKQEEARSGYVVCDDPIKPEKTVYPESPCDLCVYNPPSAGDGKPCTMCPAEGKVEE